MKIHVLAIMNGDPSANAGARLRISNWIKVLPADTQLVVQAVQRPRRIGDLFKLAKGWARGGATRNLRRVVILQKAVSLDMIAFQIYLRLSGCAVIQDICDPPIKTFNPQPFSKPFAGFFWLSFSSRFLVDCITVSSSVLLRSFSSAACSVVYVPDCTDSVLTLSLDTPLVAELEFHAGLFSSSQDPRPSLRLLWFGGAARVHSHSGIEELFAALPVLENMSSAYRLQLDICTLLDAEGLSSFREWASNASFLSIAYYPWSLRTQSALLAACDFCFLPRLQSLATFYKSPNRVILALTFNRRTISNTIASDDYENLGILMPSQFIRAQRDSSSLSCSEPPPPLPPGWSPSSICTRWELLIVGACQRSELRNRSSRPLSMIGMRLLFCCLIAFLHLRGRGKALLKKAKS